MLVDDVVLFDDDVDEVFVTGATDPEPVEVEVFELIVVEVVEETGAVEVDAGIDDDAVDELIGVNT